MTGYTRFWLCKCCNNRIETIDYSDVCVCDVCISRDGLVALRADDLTTAKLMYDIAIEKFKSRYK